MKSVPSCIEDFPMVTVYRTDFRLELLRMYQAIDQLNLWNHLELDSSISLINQNPLVIESGHSGNTFYACLNCMKFIDKNGIWAFHNEFNNREL